jgi:hypothetical protein
MVSSDIRKKLASPVLSDSLLTCASPHSRLKMFGRDRYFHGCAFQAAIASREHLATDETLESVNSSTGGPILQPFVGPVAAKPKKPFTLADQWMQFCASPSVTFAPQSAMSRPKKTPRSSVVTST